MPAQVVPWATPQEFLAVYASLFPTDEESDVSQLLAGLNRLQAWIHRGTGSHQLTSTLHFISLLHQSSPSTFSDSISHRLQLNSALIRFVNSVVDPHQQGAYAMSISKIAERVGLPSWFVELRHRGTHEEVPELEVLEFAAREALNWLRVSYWESVRRSYIPELEIKEEEEGKFGMKVEIENLKGSLKEYKIKMKVLVRDTSTERELGREILKIKEEIWEWLNGPLGEQDEERSIALCDVLTDVGYLVPLSKAKRASSLDLPSQLKAVWRPLLEFLNERSSEENNFLRDLVENMCIKICQPTTTSSSSSSKDSSKTTTLAAWIAYLVHPSFATATATTSATNITNNDLLQDTIRRLLLSQTTAGFDVVERLLTFDPLVPFVSNSQRERVNRLIQTVRLGKEDVIFEGIEDEQENTLKVLQEKIGSKVQDVKSRKVNLDQDVEMKNDSSLEQDDDQNWRLEETVSELEKIPMGFLDVNNNVTFIPLSYSSTT